MGIKLEKREFELLMLCLSLTILFSGVLLNYTVISKNDCKMPVPRGKYSIDMDDEHFFFVFKEKIKYYYLSDIISFFGGKISIGDIFIFLGMVGSFGFSIRYLIKLYFHRRRESLTCSSSPSSCSEAHNLGSSDELNSQTKANQNGKKS